MRTYIAIVVVLLMLGWAAYDFVSSEQHVSKERIEGVEVGLEQGNMAPDFELMTLNNEVVKLSDFKGTPVFLNFWATWCPPCRAEMPDLQKLYDHYDVTVLAVNLFVSEDNENEVQQFIDKFGLTFPVVLDEKGIVADMYNIQPIPTSYIIDENGRIQNKIIGALNYELMVQLLSMLEMNE